MPTGYCPCGGKLRDGACMYGCKPVHRRREAAERAEAKRVRSAERESAAVSVDPKKLRYDWAWKKGAPREYFGCGARRKVGR